MGTPPDTSERHTGFVFAVHDRVRLLVDPLAVRRNLEFLAAFDPAWITHAVQAICGDKVIVDAEALPEDYEPPTDEDLALDAHGARTLRLLYFIAAESLLSFTMAALQAPLCSYAWLDLYRSEDLAKCLEAVGEEQELLNLWRTPRWSWSLIVQCFTRHGWPLDDEPAATMRENFVRLYRMLVNDLTAEPGRSEFNALKHGTRASHGGTTVVLRSESAPGVPDQNQPPSVLGGSRHGLCWLELVPARPTDTARKAIYLQVRSHGANWSIVSVVTRLMAIEFMLRNVQSSLRIEAGTSPSEVRFWRPNHATWELALERHPSLLNSSFGFSQVSDLGGVPSEASLMRQMRKASGLPEADPDGRRDRTAGEPGKKRRGPAREDDPGGENDDPEGVR